MKEKDLLPALAKPNKKEISAGFSLIEVVIAIGIIAFAFIAIIGLIPTGLSSIKGSMQTSVMSRIAQKVISDAEQSDFTTLAGLMSSTNYFDVEGNPLPSSSNSLYWANLTTLSNAVLPGSPTNSNLYQITISVAYNPSGIAVTNWVAPPSGVIVKTFVTDVARNTYATNY